VEGQSEGGERRKKSTSASSSLALANFRVVLVAPKTPGNIGSVCRLCDCFETSHLTLVTPRCSLDSSEVKWLAVDKTKSPNFSLSRIRVVSSLKEALAETKASIAFTRRTGSLRMPHKSVATMLESDKSLLAATNGPIGLVFGREDSGLTTEELSVCSQLCSIPTGTLQPSLNLSHAVGIVLSTLFEKQTEAEPGVDQRQLASNADVDHLIGRWSQAVAMLGLETEEMNSGGQRKRRKILGHLRSILSRSGVTEKEIRALHGLCSAILEYENR